MELNIRILLSLFRAVSPTPGCAALPVANSSVAAARYVNSHDAAPTPPYTTW